MDTSKSIYTNRQLSDLEILYGDIREFEGWCLMGCCFLAVLIWANFLTKI